MCIRDSACAKNNLEQAVRAAQLLEEWGVYGEWAARLGVTREEDVYKRQGRR